jgi:hypothetical protein
MTLAVQWLIVATIGLLALWALARHFGLGHKKAGCPGCNSCGKEKVANTVGAKRSFARKPLP